ncbi:uncharacterized protein FTJAE_13767 [Fusarium tjaetaba]|uniref:Uncharacterized protein n=1 Tax=Fusarium tjaetaba TaxID=1567544 RepID=A0A8H5V7L9_9HYPO|nr:uncharacterized protein FTJAE_13767 [Fusarium tjaetaba]KAF5614117.1 hypothetical protein FTJAE_13767 [Fusarium tjaetaba]
MQPIQEQVNQLHEEQEHVQALKLAYLFIAVERELGNAFQARHINTVFTEPRDIRGHCLARSRKRRHRDEGLRLGYHVYWDVTCKKILSRKENIVTRLNLPERCDAASGEFRTAWTEGVLREFMAVEFKGGETLVIDLTRVDDDTEGSLFIAVNPDPDSAATTTTAPSHTSRASTIPKPQDHKPLDRTFKECEPINIEMARIKCFKRRMVNRSAFEDSEYQRIHNHLGNILQYLHDELGSPQTPVQAHPDVEMDTTQDTVDDPRLAEMMDRFAKMEAITESTVEAKSGDMIAVVDDEPQLNGTPLLFPCHTLHTHASILYPTPTFPVLDDTPESEKDEPEPLVASGHLERWQLQTPNTPGPSCFEPDVPRPTPVFY